jgi:hypothetical protein
MSSDEQYKSSLDKSADRFLAQALVHALGDNWRTPDDFLRHFKPLDIMKGLSADPDMRARLLSEAAGVHAKIAIKKSIESAAEDLQIALDESVTDPAAILELFPPDARVRYLDHRRLWSFLVEDEFWNNGQKERAVNRMTFMLENALSEKLITLQDIADGVSFETIARQLPPDELRKVVKHALQQGRNSAPLTEEALLEVVPLGKLIGFIPLDHIWRQTILVKVAQPCGFVAPPEAAPEPGQTETAADKEPKSEPAAASKKQSKAGSKPKGEMPKPPARPEPVAPDISTSSLDDAEEADDETRLVTTLAGMGGMAGHERTPQEEEARRKVKQKLEAIDRLPPGWDALSTPILLSIESMYAELLISSDDESREMCIRDSFPNESHLRTALLSLIELLDPSIDVNDALIRDAEIDSLIKVVLFEERHRYEQQARTSRSGAPQGGRRAEVPPPPLPRPGASGVPSDNKRAR